MSLQSEVTQYVTERRSAYALVTRPVTQAIKLFFAPGHALFPDQESEENQQKAEVGRAVVYAVTYFTYLLLILGHTAVPDDSKLTLAPQAAAKLAEII